MKTKKILSVLLALVMTLSLGVCAFADTVWTPIPTSSAGLSDGDYYVDFTDYLTAMGQANEMSNAEIAAQIAMYNGGTWYFDYTAYQLKGAITIPAAYSASGTAEQRNVPAEEGTIYLDYNVLKEVNPTWIPVAKTMNGIDNGDYYIDLSNIPAGLEAMPNYDYYVNPGSRLMEYRIDVGNGQSIFLPLQNVHFGSWLVRCPISQFNGYNWVLVPTSPNGLQKGAVWFDFSKLFSSNMTAEETAQLARFNSAVWYADFDALMVKCESSDPDLNGIYTNQHAWINCTEEVGVSWVDVNKSLAGLQVGDYYIDKVVFYQTAAAGYYTYFSAQYAAEHDDPMPEATATQLMTMSVQLTDAQYQSDVFAYNPGGNQYHYRLNGMPFPYARCMIGTGIADQTMIVVDALAASIRQVDAETAAANPWIRVATSAEAAEEGGYYLDLTDTQALMDALGMTQAPTEEEMAMLASGTWYADLYQGVVTGKIVFPAEEVGTEEDMTEWIPESEALFALLRVKPVTEPEKTDQTDTQDQSDSIVIRFIKGITSFFLRVVDFLKKTFMK